MVRWSCYSQYSPGSEKAQHRPIRQDGGEYQGRRERCEGGLFLAAGGKNAGNVDVLVPFSAPVVRQIGDLSRSGHAAESPKGLGKDHALLQKIEGFAEGMTKGPAQIHGPRRLHFLGVLPHD